MKRFTSIAFITLAIFLGVGAFAPVAYADCATGVEGVGADSGKCFDGEGNEIAGETPVEEAEATLTDPIDSAAARTQATSNDKTKADDGFGWIMTKIMTLFAWLLGVAAITLDISVYYTVVKMGNYINELSAIGIAWKVLRDFGNIVLIFGFLAIGITTILNTTVYGWSRKALPMLLLAAVFLNFSLFISQAVIDTGNLFATQFYTQINGGQPAGDKGFSVKEEGISNKIMGQVGLQTIYTAGNVNTDVFKASNSWVIGFMGIILFIVAAFVMFALAFILISRFVYLIYLIILSPLGFAGLAVPKLEGAAKKWWNDLFTQAATAPILLLLLYLALNVITDDGFLRGFGVGTSPDGWVGWIQRTSGTDNLAGFAGLLLSFLVSMGLLLFVVIASKKLSAFGGDWATKTAGKLSFGATAWAGRSSFGWGSQRTSELLRKTRFARVPVLGRAVIGGLDKASKATYDARGVKAFGGLSALKMGELGKPAEGGYRKWEEDKVKEREKYAKDLKQTGREKNAQTAAESQKKRSEEEIERIQNRYKPQIEEATEELRSANDALAQARAAGASTTVAEAEVARVKAARRALLDSQQAEIDPHKTATAVAQAEADAARTAPQVQYAKRIAGVPGWIFKRNKTARDNIIKEASKSKAEKDVDTLKDILERAARGAGGGTPPATPPPPTP